EPRSCHLVPPRSARRRLAAVLHGQPLGRQRPWLRPRQHLQSCRRAGRLGGPGRPDPRARGLEVTLAAARHWVFDMDGTLTIVVHAAPAITRALETPPEDAILHHLAAWRADEAAAKRGWLLDHERELAYAASPAAGALEWLQELRDGGCRIGG